MTYATVNGQQLWYETPGSGGARPLVLLHGGLVTSGLTFGPLLAPLAARGPLIVPELQGHGHTPDTDRPLTVDALAGDVVGLLDQLGVAQADFFGFSLGGLVASAVAVRAPSRVGRLIIASADPHRPPGRESAPISADRLPTREDYEGWRAAHAAVAPVPAQFEVAGAKTTAMVHEVAPLSDELRSLRVPVLLVFGDRDFSPLADVAELLGLLPDGQLAVLPGATHVGVIQHPAQLLALITPFLDED